MGVGEERESDYKYSRKKKKMLDSECIWFFFYNTLFTLFWNLEAFCKIL